MYSLLLGAGVNAGNEDDEQTDVNRCWWGVVFDGGGHRETLLANGFAIVWA
jgi:hypothetical protein